MSSPIPVAVLLGGIWGAPPAFIPMQDTAHTLATVVVLPVATEGYPRVPETTVRQLTEALENTLAGDSTLRWLPRDPRERSRDTAGGPIPAALYAVAGRIKASGRADFWVVWQVVSVASGRVFANDSLHLVPGHEREAGVVVGRHVSETLARRRSSRPRDPPRPGVRTAMTDARLFDTLRRDWRELREPSC